MECLKSLLISKQRIIVSISVGFVVSDKRRKELIVHLKIVIKKRDYLRRGSYLLWLVRFSWFVFSQDSASEVATGEIKLLETTNQRSKW